MHIKGIHKESEMFLADSDVHLCWTLLSGALPVSVSSDSSRWRQIESDEILSVTRSDKIIIILAVHNLHHTMTIKEKALESWGYELGGQSAFFFIFEMKSQQR